MANLNEPSRIKELFSSFISNINLISGRKNVDNNKRTDEIVTNSDKDPPTPTVNNQKDEQTDKSPSTERKNLDTVDSRNRTEYYQRVATYSPVTWCAKPLDLSPLVCARYGWLNVDVDMLQCAHCGAFLCGQLPKAVTSKHYRDSCNKLKQNLKDGHEKLCKWASTPSPDTFTQVPCGSRGEIMKDFCSRVTSLCAIEDQLPDVSYSSIVGQSDDKKLSEERLHDVVEKVSSYLNDMNIKCTEKTIIYGMTGWAYQESQKDIQVLWCNFCCRKVGLWNYSSSDSQTDESTTEEPALKKQKITSSSFDPVAGHRYWCPWIQNKPLSDSSQPSFSPNSSPVKSLSSSPASSAAASESSQGSPVKQTTLPTWLHVALVLAKQVYLDGEEDFLRQIKQSPHVEGLRHIRQVLKDCTTPPPKQQSPHVEGLRHIRQVLKDCTTPPPKQPVFSDTSPINF